MSSLSKEAGTICFPAGSLPQQQRILVYDDDEGSAYAFGTILRRAGYEVDLATHFEPALKTLEHKQIDLLLTDIVVPGGVNGMAMARMAHMKRSTIKVIYLTGHDIPAANSVAPVLRKPISDEELLSAVQKALTSP